MYRISEIAEMSEGLLVGRPDSEVCRLLMDSRLLSFPDDTLFVAIKSSRDDGHKYIDDLYRRNVRNFMISTDASAFAEYKDANFVVVKDTVQALQRLTANHRKHFNVPVIGITGSNGKTIVKEWLYQLLHKDYHITRSPRSYNSQIGVPLSVWEMTGETQLALFEVGISQMDEMGNLAPIVRPTIGVFTNLGEAHQENFASLKQKCLEKMKLYEGCGTIIYCKDDKLVDICAQQMHPNAHFITFGRQKGATLQVTSEQFVNGTTQITYLYAGKEQTISIPFTDYASIDNAMHCVCVLIALGLDAKSIAARLLDLESVAMRMEVKDGENGCLLINDSYNSDINSLSIALDFLAQQATAKNMSKTLILSDIFQSGKEPDELYCSVAELVEKKNVERFIGIGADISKYEQCFNVPQKSFYADTDAFMRQVDALSFENEAILLKGSRAFHFETITDKLAKVVHETVLEVNLTALVNNFNYFRSFLKPGTKIMSMVKANAYGSGDIEVARTLQQNGCDYLAVAVADEGAVLRREGIHIPIVVMNPEPNSFLKIFENNLEPEVYSFALLKRMISEAEKLGITDYPIHLKMDTGMHRLGFELKDLDELIALLKSQKCVKPRSMFSHLVGSDDVIFDDFTKKQIALFGEMKQRLFDAFPYKIMAHILNSAGIERFSDYQFDMVRLGIGHYGMSAVDSSRLEEVCTLKTNILQIRRVPASDTVGYSRKGTLTRDSVIGAIPIGYADGFNRKLGNRNGKVLVNGCFAPIVGNVCMDVCMIDLTDVPNVKEGDTVVLFGKGHPIQGVADTLGTISYEVLAGISKRVKRVYYRE